MSSAPALRAIFEALRDREDPPQPWSGPGEVPWEDQAFSSDYARAAARDAATTEDEFNFIASSVELPVSPGPNQQWNVLDLGCGDGRLLIPLARLGHRGFGIDLGPAPIAQLTERAQQSGLSIDAVTGDLGTWARGEAVSGTDGWPDGNFQLMLLSFGTLGSFPAEVGSALLDRAATALAPGGWLAADLGLSVGYAMELDGRQEWWTAEDFVLGSGPQLVLDDHAFDPTQRIYVRRSYAIHLVDPPRLGVVQQTSQLYEQEELRGMLADRGFDILRECGDFLDTPYDAETSENLVVIARKRD